MILGPFYAMKSSDTFHQRKCFVFVILIFVCLSVCHITYMPFVQSILEYGNFFRELPLMLVNGDVILRSKRPSRNENVKSFFWHIFVRSGSIYIKRRPKWSSAHSTHIVGYISPAEILRFCDVCIVCRRPSHTHISCSLSFVTP